MVKNFRDTSSIFSSLKRLKVALLLLVLLGMSTPAIAQTENRNSRLRVQFDLDRRGRLTNVEFIEGSGNRDFDKATLEAIEEMRFERSDAKREGISADIDIEFNGLDAYEYPPEVFNSFVDGCKKDPESYNFCVCMMKAAQRRYPLDTFIAVGCAMRTGSISMVEENVEFDAFLE